MIEVLVARWSLPAVLPKSYERRCGFQRIEGKKDIPFYLLLLTPCAPAHELLTVASINRHAEAAAGRSHTRAVYVLFPSAS